MKVKTIVAVDEGELDNEINSFLEKPRLAVTNIDFEAVISHHDDSIIYIAYIIYED